MYYQLTAEAVSKLKVATGSNQSLLQLIDDDIVVAGLPVLVWDQVDASTLVLGHSEAARDVRTA